MSAGHPAQTFMLRGFYCCKRTRPRPGERGLVGSENEVGCTEVEANPFDLEIEVGISRIAVDMGHAFVEVLIIEDAPAFARRLVPVELESLISGLVGFGIDGREIDLV